MGRIRPVPHKVSWGLKIITFDLTTDPFFIPPLLRLIVIYGRNKNSRAWVVP